MGNFKQSMLKYKFLVLCIFMMIINFSVYSTNVCKKRRDCQKLCPNRKGKCIPSCKKGECSIKFLPIMSRKRGIKRRTQCKNKRDCVKMCPRQKGKCLPECKKGLCAIAFLPLPLKGGE